MSLVIGANNTLIVEGKELTVEPIQKNAVHRLSALDHLCFAEEIAYDADGFLEELENPTSFGAHVYDKNTGSSIAYILANNDAKTRDNPASVLESFNGAYLVSTAVHPRYRRRRIFSQLLSMVERECAQRGLGGIRAHTQADSIALTCFKHLGFRPIGGHINYYEPGNAIEMIKGNIETLPYK